MWSKNGASRWLASLAFLTTLASPARADEVLIKLIDIQNGEVQATVRFVSPRGGGLSEIFKGEKRFKCTEPETMVEVEPGPLHYILPTQRRRPCAGVEVIFVFQIHGRFDYVNTGPRDPSKVKKVK